MATCWLTAEAKNRSDRKKFKCPGRLNSVNKSGNIIPTNVGAKLGGVLWGEGLQAIDGKEAGHRTPAALSSQLSRTSPPITNGN